MDILKIISSITAINHAEDKRYNATGKKELVVGEHDKKVGIMDEYGNIEDFGNGLEFELDGSSGEIRISSHQQAPIIKWGRVVINVGREGTFVFDGTFPTPFPNGCSVMFMQQIGNDLIGSVMVDPNKTGYTATIAGGRDSESFSYLAIGY